MTLPFRPLFLTALLLSACFPLQAEEETEVFLLGLVTGDHVNLRAGPGASYEVIAQFPRLAHLQLLAQKGDWYAVPLPDSVPAFVHRDFLRIETNEWARIRGNRVHVRAGPGLGSASYGFLPDGERVRPWEERGDWVAIQAPGFCRGWIHRSYLTVLESAEQTQGGSP